jgi:subtilisin family serine protease
MRIGWRLGGAVLAVALATTVGASDAPRRAHAVDSTHLNYALSGTVDELLGADDAHFNLFATKVRDDLDWLMDTHYITDRTSLRSILAVRLAFQVLSGTEDQAALFTVNQIRNLEDKPGSRMIAAFEVQALLEARRETGREDGPEVVRAYDRFLHDDLEGLPWPLVGESIRATTSSSEVVTPALIRGMLTARIGPSLAKTHALSAGEAWQLINARFALRIMLPLEAETHAVLARMAAEHEDTRPDIWTAREVTLSPADKLTPVTVAIWDSGVDLAQFPGRTYADPTPAPGADPHGLAFDLQGLPTGGELFPIDAAHTRQYPAFIHELKGFSELEAALSTPDSDALKHKLAGLTAAEVGQETEALEYFAQYVHGTHVAGIAARGNPAIRLAVGRISFDWRMTPEPPSEALAQRQAADFQTFVRWFRDHRVRVVNMSWEETRGGIYGALERGGVGATSQARMILAKHLFEIESAGLRKALESAPDILFICAAGNSGADTGSVKGIPSSFVLPNLLAVGAVDQAGDEAGFTNYGQVVRVDADGVQVDSVLPGGTRAALSGTSMAAPNVVNLAAKLLALNPSLTPPQVIRLIVDAATPSADGRLHNINPKRSVELLRGVKAGA